MNKSIRIVALNILAGREHSIDELRSKLLAKSFTENEVELMLDELINENLLNEFRFAECYCRSRISRGYGPIAIKHELNLKKVNKEIVHSVLEQVESEWSEIVKRTCQKKFSSSIQLDQKQKEKCWRFLLQRGFLPDHIRAVLKVIQ